MCPVLLDSAQENMKGVSKIFEYNKFKTVTIE